MRIRFAFVTLLMLALPLSAKAQRLIDHQPYVSVQLGALIPTASTPFMPMAHLDYGGCTHAGKWYIGAAGGSASQGYSANCYYQGEGPFDFNFTSRDIDLQGEGAYLLRIASNRKRSVALWGGVGANVGARLYKFTDGFVPQELPSVRFQYGFFPQVSFEFFLSKSVSMDIFSRLRFQFRVAKKTDAWFVDKDFFFPEAGVSLNFYFFYD